jgi:hypothetical protein
MTTITLTLPVDVIESIKEIAPKRGFSDYQYLLTSYLGDGLRRDENQCRLESEKLKTKDGNL